LPGQRGPRRVDGRLVPGARARRSLGRQARCRPTRLVESNVAPAGAPGMNRAQSYDRSCRRVTCRAMFQWRISKDAERSPNLTRLHQAADCASLELSRRTMRSPTSEAKLRRRFAGPAVHGGSATCGASRVSTRRPWPSGEAARAASGASSQRAAGMLDGVSFSDWLCRSHLAASHGVACSKRAAGGRGSKPGRGVAWPRPRGLRFGRLQAARDPIAPQVDYGGSPQQGAGPSGRAALGPSSTTEAYQR